MIPFEVGMTLDKAYEQEEMLRDFLKSDEEAAEIWEMALKLEGITRGTGKHAGGVVIAPTKLTDFSPIACDEEGGGLVTQFDKDDVEAAGLVKFDFLGLRTLTIIKWAMEIINREQAKKGLEPVNIDFIPLDDKPTYSLLQKAETTAVFQARIARHEGAIKKLKPDCLEDLIALVALFRPGPLQSGMVDDFINRKHGRAELSYPHPDYQYAGLEPVLKPTYGIILYQEQVMQIAQVMAGYTLGGADMLRRAMGKSPRKWPSSAAVSSRVARTTASMPISRATSSTWWKNSPATASTNRTRQPTAWSPDRLAEDPLPGAFMAAVLTADMQNTDKVVTLIEECRHMKLRIVAPDVNNSEFRFTVDDDGRIVYGLGAIKGVGEGWRRSPSAAPKAPFNTLFDFCDRVDLKRINKRTLEALIRAGALDRLGPHYHDELKAYQATVDLNRAVLLAAMEKRSRPPSRPRAATTAGTWTCSAESSPSRRRMSTPTTARSGATLKERLKGEKVYLTGHPIDEYEARCGASPASASSSEAGARYPDGGRADRQPAGDEEQEGRQDGLRHPRRPLRTDRGLAVLRSLRRGPVCCRPMRWWWSRGGQPGRLLRRTAPARQARDEPGGSAYRPGGEPADEAARRPVEGRPPALAGRAVQPPSRFLPDHPGLHQRRRQGPAAVRRELAGGSGGRSDPGIA